MRRLYTLLAILLAGLASHSQTTLINSGFETGEPTAWSVANDAVNKWFIGTATANGGSQSAYISNNGGVSNVYTTSVANVSHLYTPVAFPAGQGAIILRFDAKGIGQHLTSVLDYVRVSLTSSAPVAGSMPAVTDQLPVFISAQPNFATFWVVVPASYAGTTRNLVFSFRCAGSGGSTAFAIDNVRLTAAVPAPLSGTKTIRAGGTYTGFGEAIANLNAHGVGGSLTFNVDPGTVFNETPPAITVVASSDVVFQKAGGGTNPRIVATGSGNDRTTSTGTITGSNDAVLALAGCDRITFDGIDFASADYAMGVSAIEYGVYVYNTSGTNGSQNNTIRNTAITLNRTNISTVGIFQNTATTPSSVNGANSNNRYYNLNLTNSAQGILLNSTSASLPDLNTEVGTTACTVFNTIGDPAKSHDIGNSTAQTWGIRAVNQNGIKIFNNRVSNVTSTGNAADGIVLEPFLGSCEVYNNIVSGILVNSISSTESASGIRLSHPTSGTHVIKVYNNFVTGIGHAYAGTPTGNRYIKGIFVSGTGGSANQLYLIDFNTVRIDGSAASNASSAALEISTSTGPVHFFRNNILANLTSVQNSPAAHYAFVGPLPTKIGNGTSLLAYNDLYVPNGAGSSGFVGRGGSANYSTIADLQAAYNDATNNLSVNPQFVSATDLHASAAALNGAADPAYASANGSPWVTKDIDCETRKAATDIGADEYDPPSVPCTAPAAPTAMVFANQTTSSATGSFTAVTPAPSGYLVVLSQGALTTGPVNGTTYSSGAAIGNGTVLSVGSLTGFTLNGLQPNTAYTVSAYSFNNTNCQNGPAYSTTPLAGQVVTCPATPGTPTVTAQGPTSFSLSFTSSKGGSGAPVSYSLEVATDANFTTPVTGSPFTFADNSGSQATASYTVSGLAPSTLYFYRLRAEGCNTATVTGTATTGCAAVAVPYVESFESITAPNTLPSCMSASPGVLASGKTQTYTAPGSNVALTPRTGSKFAAVYWNPANSAGYFFTAPLQLTGGITYTASVWYKTDGVAWTDATIYYGSSPTPAAMTTTVAQVVNAAATTYTQIIGSFTPPTTGVYYVGIRGFNATSSPNFIAFDDIAVDAAANCATPLSPVVSNVNASGATISWSAPVPAPATYEVYYSTAATPPTAGTTPSRTGITGTSTALSGLSSSTLYYAWVRGNCGGNGASAWTAAPVSFTTLCGPVNVPYTENFNSATPPALPVCTSREDVNADGTTWVTAAAPTGYTGSVLQYGYHISNAANDWFYTAGLNLAGGKQYTLTFRYGNNSTLTAEKLRVYSGATPSAGAMTTLLRDFPSVTGNTPNTATINFTPATSGVYYIGFNVYSAANQFNLYIDDIAVTGPPANDDASGAFTLTLGSGCTGNPYSNSGATQSAGEPFASCKGTAGYNTVWFKFTAPASGAVRISNDYAGGTMGADSRMGLYSASDPANYATFSLIGCDDDNGTTVAARSVLFATGLTPGNTYYVQVDGGTAATTTGSFCITVDELSSTMVSAPGACTPAQDLTGINTGYTGWLSLTDAAGKLIAQVKDLGGNGGTFSGAVTANAGAVRTGGAIAYLDRNYFLSNSASTNVKLQFFFLGTEMSALTAVDGTTLGTLGVTRQTGSVCRSNFSSANGASSFLPQTANASFNGVNFIEVNTPGFSNFFLNKTGAVLPVNLLAFSGQRQGTANLLRWTVAQEQDVRAYEVERSEDGMTWRTVGSVNSQGNTVAQRNYTFSDNSLAGLRQHYRLRIADLNGAVKLSNVIVISGARSQGLVMSGLYPNPASTTLNVQVETPARQTINLLVVDGVGRTVLARKVLVDAGTNAVSIKVAGLAQGAYLVKLSGEDGKESAVSRFIKE